MIHHGYSLWVYTMVYIGMYMCMYVCALWCMCVHYGVGACTMVYMVNKGNFGESSRKDSRIEYILFS